MVKLSVQKEGRLKCAKDQILDFFLQSQFFDPLGQPTVTAGRDHCFRTCCPPSVRPHFLNLEKPNKQKTMFATGVTMGLAEWIIDDTCPVFIIYNLNIFYHTSSFLFIIFGHPFYETRWRDSKKYFLSLLAGHDSHINQRVRTTFASYLGQAES